ncbi:MAG TPA: type II secretion system protein [Chthoniobacterales bacterium]|nr:type II secretion system protein [Chthoniobacterales bacterium]
MNNIKPNPKASQRGTTLIELSVVIAVILLLVSVLFIGISAWKNGANAAACIVNLASMQKAVRGYQNMNQLATSAAAPIATLVSQGFFGAAPSCPGGGTYNGTAVVPAPGAAYATCSLGTTVSPAHAPSSAALANW